MKKVCFVLVKCLLCFLALSNASQATARLPDNVSVTLKALQSSYAESDALLIELTYKNISSQPIRMLQWDTGLDGGIFHDFLDVRINGFTLAYSGWHAKTAEPTDKDYIVLEPSQSVSAEVDLADAYPIYDQGVYQVSYKLDEIGLSAKQLSGNSITMTLSEQRAVTLFKQPARNINGSCTTGQFNTADAALVDAERISLIATRALNNAPPSLRSEARRYVEWFGRFEERGYDTVAAGMRRIFNAARNSTIGFDCNCRAVFGSRASSIFAAVNPNDPFNILLCDIFWLVPRLGTDSQSGTIVHELSHFNIVAATDDFSSALNQAGSRTLARNSPASARLNANAFEYFAENTPNLPMPTEADLPPETAEMNTGFIPAIIMLLFGEEVIR